MTRLWVWATLLIAGGLALAGLSGGLFRGQAPEAARDADPGRLLVVEPRPVERILTIPGLLHPGQTLAVAAPFDGMIRADFAAYGDAVKAGAPLVALDTAEITLKAREAEISLLKAEQEQDSLAHWATGPAVSHARHALVQAQQQQDQLTVSLRRARALLERGIVAGDEVDQLEQQSRAAALQVAEASQELTAMLAQGGPEAQHLASLHTMVERQILTVLEQQKAAATVLAPGDGIVLRPEAGPGGADPPSLDPGTQLQAGHPLLLLGIVSNLVAKAVVDEIDIGALAQGQRVTVTGDGFSGLSLTGQVVAIASIGAVDPASGNRIPHFALTVRLDPVPPVAAARLRLGMSCMLHILVYHNPAALIIPADALSGDANVPEIKLVKGGRVIATPVRLGISLPEGIEITDGLTPGAIVMRSLP